MDKLKLGVVLTVRDTFPPRSNAFENARRIKTRLEGIFAAMPNVRCVWADGLLGDGMVTSLEEAERVSDCFREQKVDALGAPLFLMYYPNFKETVSFKEFVGFKALLEKKYSMSLITHLDHSRDIEEIKRAVDAGFDSIMLDYSDRPVEENIRGTAQVAELAHSAGVAVEAELGRVGSGSNAVDFKDPALYTDPDKARAFCGETRVDMLAVAVGNSHGVYVEEPELDIGLLKRIAAATDTPLVLHGTSLIPDGQVADAVANGICKINLATEMYQAAMKAIKAAVRDGGVENQGPFFADTAIKPAMQRYFEHKLRLLGWEGKGAHGRVGREPGGDTAGGGENQQLYTLLRRGP